MKDKLQFKENQYHPQMDRIWINDSYAGTNLARWAFDDLPENKKEMVYDSLRELYYLGFERGKQNKVAEIRDLLVTIESTIK